MGLPLTYDIANEGNPNSYGAKIDKSWTVLEGVSTPDPTLAFIIEFDVESPWDTLFGKETGYFTVGVQFEYNDTVYEIESNLSNDFVTFTKNAEDVYGNIENAHYWLDNKLKISIPISTFDLTKEDLFDVSNKVNMKLFYRNLDTGLRVWESSLLTRLFFEKPTYHSPKTVTVNMKATENFRVQIKENQNHPCAGSIVEHDGMRQHDYSFYEFAHFNTHTEYILENHLQESIIIWDFKPNTTECGTVIVDTNFGSYQTGNALKVSGSEFKLTTHDLIRLFSPVTFYGNEYTPTGISSWESLTFDDYNVRVFNTENNFFSEKFDSEELFIIGGDKLRCPEPTDQFCLDDQIKPWEGTIVLDKYANDTIASLNFNDTNLANCVNNTASENNWTYVNEVVGLDCTESGIVDLAGLEKLTYLNILKLGYNTFEDIYPLSKLSELKVLYLNFTGIEDISALSKLNSLNYLELGGNHISDISALSNMTYLNVLYLGFNMNISDLSPLSDLTSLTTLDLYYNKISDITVLSKLTLLTDLFLFKNNISDLSAISELTLLNNLDLSNNSFSDLTPLNGLNHLSELNLSENSNVKCEDIDTLKITLSSTNILSDSSCIP